jgi:hypothetical protein
MLWNRRRIWAIGLALGLLVVAFFLFGPKMTVEQRIAEEVAILAREPWQHIHVQQVDFEGSRQDPSDVFVYGARPDGTPVIIEFAEGSPYTSPTAMRRLAEKPLAGSTVEFVLMPRSMVESRYRDRYEPNVTHAGIALFAGIQAAEDTQETQPHDAPQGPPDAAEPNDAAQEEVSQHGNG